VILTVEQILRHAGIHKRFLCGKKTVHPNQKSSFYNNTNPDHEEDERDICFGLFRHCLHCSQDSCLRLLAAIYFGLNELKYQLWEGERYDTLEALKPCLVRYIYYFSNITPVISKASQSNSLLLNSCSISLHSNDLIQL